MAFALAEACSDRGGVVLNYFKVSGLLKDNAGKINGVTAKDLVTDKDYLLKSKLVINATGVFADSIAKMDNPGSKPSLRPSQGVHIVLDKSFLSQRFCHYDSKD